MKKLLIATGNQGKFREISNYLADLPLELISLEDVEVDDSSLVEDGETYAENAYKKAHFYAQQTGLITLADDSGIIIEALKGELGVKTRRWGAGPEASDQEWIDHFLKRMENEENRKAEFVCYMCIVDSNGSKLYESRGSTKGKLTRELLAPIYPGIPLSSCFIVDGYGTVHSAMSIEEKNKISHRGKALKEIKGFFSKHF